MNPDLNGSVAQARIADWLRQAERPRRSRGEPSETTDAFEAVTVRLARAVDAQAVARLSALDGRHVPRGPTLVAEFGGAVLAARSLENGSSVADPFRPTEQLTELLEVRAAHLQNIANAQPHRRAWRLRGWLRALRP